MFERLSRHRARKGGEEEVGCIHGDLAQNVRDRVMKQFREGAVKVLVATDVVGRGIDVTALSHIINYDIPEFCDDYVHRVGRTGRMGREGLAYTFVAPDEGPQLTRIEMRIEKLLHRDEIPGFEAFDRRAKAAPIQQTGPGGAFIAAEGQPAAPPPEPEAPKKPSSARVAVRSVIVGPSEPSAPSPKTDRSCQQWPVRLQVNHRGAAGNVSSPALPVR